MDVSAFTHFLKREKSFESRKRYNSEATIRAAIHCVRLRNTRKRSVRAAKNVRHDVIRWRRLLVVDDFAHGHAPHGVNALSLDIRLSYLSSTREIGNVSRNDTAGVGNWVFEWNGGNCYEERERRKAGKQCLCCERIVEYIVRACNIDESMSSDMFCWIMVSIAAQLNKLASDIFFLSYRTCRIIMLVFYKNYTCQILIYYIPWCRLDCSWYRPCLGNRKMALQVYERRILIRKLIIFVIQATLEIYTLQIMTSLHATV